MDCLVILPYRLVLHPDEVWAFQKHYFFHIKLFCVFTPIKLAFFPHFRHFVASGVMKSLFRGMDCLVILPIRLVLHSDEVWASQKHYFCQIKLFCVFSQRNSSKFPSISVKATYDPCELFCERKKWKIGHFLSRYIELKLKKLLLG